MRGAEPKAGAANAQDETASHAVVSGMARGTTDHANFVKIYIFLTTQTGFHAILAGMKPLLFSSLLIVAMTVAAVAEDVIAESSEPSFSPDRRAAPPQLVVYLSDGSKLHGTTTLTGLMFRSEALGNVTVPLKSIASVKFSKDHETVILAFHNGDRLQGAIGLDSLVLQSLAGQVTIPFNVVRDMVVSAPQTDAGLREGLVAHYPFNGDVKDHSGNENHGKVVGAEFAPVGIQFRGDGGTHVLVPRSASLEPTTGITVSMWLKGVPGQEAGHGWGTILRKSGHCSPGYGFRGGGISSFNIEGPNPCSGTCKGAAFGTFEASRWQQVTGVYSQEDGTIKTYQDGELMNQTPLTGPLLHSGDLYLGGAVVASDDGGFRGTMAEVRIYNRALSESEILALAAKPPSRK